MKILQLLGPLGAGKTTLMKGILADHPTSAMVYAPAVVSLTAGLRVTHCPAHRLVMVGDYVQAHPVMPGLTDGHETSGSKRTQAAIDRALTTAREAAEQWNCDLAWESIPILHPRYHEQVYPSLKLVPVYVVLPDVGLAVLHERIHMRRAGGGKRNSVFVDAVHRKVRDHVAWLEKHGARVLRLTPGPVEAHVSQTLLFFTGKERDEL